MQLFFRHHLRHHRQQHHAYHLIGRGCAVPAYLLLRCLRGCVLSPVCVLDLEHLFFFFSFSPSRPFFIFLIFFLSLVDTYHYYY
ncbi:hypothetical protein GGS23DRAFT_578843 [Durotheca rogersii]|uniref:uncharacterized protein n=1 Tax=Durotheca rogersii TaxID=419775 RepID=UPI002220725A|nr:uncharacterized protein GGS23DRAFT_578843 [Durotheca rogersii]KAI5860773.1 hypothetical protein GGS23DRAFT_578843 [Durotheca rogersii]